MGKIQQVVTTDKKKINKTIFAGFAVLIFLMISKYESAWKTKKNTKKNNVELKYWIRSEEINK